MGAWLLALGVLLAFGVALWLASVAVRDASIIDVFWGPMFIVIAGVSFAFGDGLAKRKLLVLGLAALWGLRLAVHLGFRNLGKGEDRRYRAMRERIGPRFWIISLPMIFLFQPLLAFVVGLPLQAAMRLGEGAPLSLLDALGAALFFAGFAMEAVADFELARFRRNPESHERVLDTGLFRYSRHPNYFGDALLWWGFGLFGVAAGAPWSLVGPLVMTVLLMRVSGVTLLERTIGARRPEYSSYKLRTNAFFPGPPNSRRSSHAG